MAANFSEKIDDRIVTVTLARPDVLNSFDVEMLAQFKDAIERLSEREDIRVLIITGEGASFCSGVRLSSVVELATANDIRSLQKLTDLTRQLISLVRRLPQFTIASVNGLAVDGGLNLALACDHVVASDQALFGYPFVHLGLCPDVGTSSLFAARVGSVRAFRLLLSGKLYNSAAIKRLGLVQEFVPHRKLIQRTLELSGWATTLPAGVVRGLKRNLNPRNDLTTSILEAEVDTRIRCFLSDDFREGIESFKNNRQPRFSGQ